MVLESQVRKKTWVWTPYLYTQYRGQGNGRPWALATRNSEMLINRYLNCPWEVSQGVSVGSCE